jgi:hypothetical protein
MDQAAYALLLSQLLTATVLVRLTLFSHRSQSLDTNVVIMQDLVYFQAQKGQVKASIMYRRTYRDKALQVR